MEKQTRGFCLTAENVDSSFRKTSDALSKIRKWISGRGAKYASDIEGVSRNEMRSALAFASDVMRKCANHFASMSMSIEAQSRQERKSDDARKESENENANGAE